ncbi:hypothetical protein V2J09_007701 [Rumex salicifolius]
MVALQVPFSSSSFDYLTISSKIPPKPPKGQAKWKGGSPMMVRKSPCTRLHCSSTTKARLSTRGPRPNLDVDVLFTGTSSWGCTKCSKQRRFLLRTKQECRLYHDACLDENWTCADFPNQEVCCEDDEERQPKKILRGCFMRPLCKGCNFCVCFGCFMCRFEDCKCRSCVDFIKNAGF